MEIKAGLGDDIGAALEAKAQLLLGTLKASATIGDLSNKVFDSKVMFAAIEAR